jgi:threonine/homoserine/homoserine lactone efflux protein
MPDNLRAGQMFGQLARRPVNGIPMREPILFLLTVLLILGTPGPTNTLLATGGGTLGFRRALPLVPAEASGYLITVLTVGLLLGPVIKSFPLLALGLRLAVGVYLVILSAKLWRHQPVDLTVAPVTPRQVFLTTLLNPKGIVFALVVIPFGIANWAVYVACFLILVVAMSVSWILLGATLQRIAKAAGHARLVTRVGATAIGIFATILLVSPLMH